MQQEWFFWWNWTRSQLNVRVERAEDLACSNLVKVLNRCQSTLEGREVKTVSHESIVIRSFGVDGVLGLREVDPIGSSRSLGGHVL